MRYFRLVDDVAILGRWHLGEAMRRETAAVDLCNGEPAANEPLSVAISRQGHPLEFTLTSFGVPIVTTRLAMKVDRVAHADMQQILTSVDGSTGYVALNVTRLVACVDEARSEFVKWTSQDHRADLAGQYRAIHKLCLDSANIPPDAHFFRVANWTVGIMISDLFRETMVAANCCGAKFLELE